MTDIKFLNIKQVKEITSVSTATLYRLMAINKFPKPFNISARRVAWSEADVQNWINNTLEQANNNPQELTNAN